MTKPGCVSSTTPTLSLNAAARVGGLPYDLSYLAASARASSGLPLTGRYWGSPFVVDLISRPHVIEDGWSPRELGWSPAVTSLAPGLAGLARWVWESAAAAGRAPLLA